MVYKTPVQIAVRERSRTRASEYLEGARECLVQTGERCNDVLYGIATRLALHRR